MANGMTDFIRGMPKAELHVHIEGTVQASQILKLAKRNKVDIPYDSERALLDAQNYPEPVLVNFLNYHYLCSSVLRNPQDIYEITLAYLNRCVHENIRHTEISFDPQPHVERGIGFDELIDALNQARRETSDRDHVSSQLIMCMNRDRSEASAMQMLELAADHKDHIAGVGLDSYEKDNPPLKFLEFYRRAKSEGYHLTAHCDCHQENSVNHIHQCIDDLDVERIDHGLHCLDDPLLTSEIRDRGITLTMCPTWRPSDPAPRRVNALRQMLDLELPVTLNTDDPEEFESRYLTNMMIAVQKAGDFSAAEMTRFMRNAFVGSWVAEPKRQGYLRELAAHLDKFEEETK